MDDELDLELGFNGASFSETLQDTQMSDDDSAPDYVDEEESYRTVKYSRSSRVKRIDVPDDPVSPFDPSCLNRG